MNNELFGANELSKIDNERLIEIKNYALREYNRYMDKILNASLSIRQPINCNSISKKQPKKIYKPNLIKNLNGLTLEQQIEYKANTGKFNLNNDTKKMLFICSGIFPNDEKFLNILLEHNYLIVFDNFINMYIFADKKYKEKPALANMQKYRLYLQFIKFYKDELAKIIKYFNKFYCVTNINLIINKLLQIYYFNPELYNSYIEINENKKTSQKVNKIG